MSDARSLFQVVIEAIDKVSAPIEKINAKIHAMGASMREVGDRLEHLGQVSGIEALGEKFGHLRESIAGAGEKLAEFLGPLAALTALGSLAGLGELVVRVGEAGEQLERTSKIIGVTVEQLQELHNAATMTGTPIEAMDKGLEMLNRRLGDAGRGKNKDLLGLLGKMPGALNAQHKPMLNAAQMLPLIADLYQRNTNAATRAAISTALFGKAGQQLTPALIAGRAALEKWAEEQREAGEMSAKQGAQAQEFAEHYNRLKLSVTGLATQIGLKLMPVLEPLITGLTIWLDKHRDIIATHIEHAVTRLADALGKVDWVAFARGVEHAADVFAHFAGDTLGLKGSLMLLAAFLAAPMLSAIAGVASALAGLGAASLFTPVTAGIALIGVAGFELYEHWGAIAKWWHSTWQGMADDVSRANDKIKPPVVTNRVENHQSGRYANIPRASDSAGADTIRWDDRQQGKNTNASWVRGRHSPFEALDASKAALVAAHDKFVAFGESLRLSVLPLMPLATIGGVPITHPGSRAGAADRFGGAGRDLDVGGGLTAAVRDLNTQLSGRSWGTIDVNINGAPPGTRTVSRSTGPVVPKAHVGINMQDHDDGESRY